ncbi:translation initiation factor eIF-2B subunit delta [Marchantia polymorpha subsp. ruderalis]|uniref:Translation initiation factor eIF2B subunit delta n=2 Tax=Marchantia polymorpha TaxID=3197 RepID=A0AAF6B997_MARPO|nr:hypothetical protein MARPO_0138s0007 [Marchantia polymorpha]BBN08581.1 hypothetical protein Mp_4g12680 [Marchantia polymorpha subsp. ruderalis]|eukprot:PTQ29567.1 hypothetical protein MARPO_0138s0007 [Marchantia polymorpha]
MERRGRAVIDPKVRQVGFVTPGEGTDLINLAIPLEQGANSPSPVLIPPVRINDGASVAPAKAAPMPVPSPTSRRHPTVDVNLPLGSYNPADSVLGSSNTPSSGKAGSHGESLRSSATFIELQSETSDYPTVGSGTIAPVLITEKGPPPPLHIPPGGSSPLTPMNVQADKGKSQKVGLDEKAKEGKTKSLKERTSKAERRAAQEAQRAAKKAAEESGGSKPTKGDVGGTGASQKDSKASKGTHQKTNSAERRTSSSGKPADKGQEKEKKKDVPAPRMQFDDAERVAKAKKRSLVEQTETKNRVELFRHLPQFVHGTQLPSLESKFFQDESMHPHPAIYKVGLQYLTGDLVGGNARCVAMLMAFREMIQDYSTPPEKIFVRDLTQKINSHVSFLNTCRPLAISMGNAIKFLKTRVVNLAEELSEAEAKASLIAEIDRFIQEKILYADKEIVKHAVQKIRDGDVCLTYGSSCVVEMILLKAHEMGKKFRVVVVDSRPKLEGKRLLKRLLSEGLDCTYTYINAMSYIMQEVTRVFLGAASVLANGTVYSRVGTASVAMVAHAFSVPVMICCETYKFHERVQLDSITANELGNPDALVKVWGRRDLTDLEGWSPEDKHLQLLNLTYDATPSDYVAMVITELGMVPPSSVPVILREYRRELPG